MLKKIAFALAALTALSGVAFASKRVIRAIES